MDPEWVENLNSTLDDSKLLCLANGERVELQPGMRVLIETDDLINASPATVSRCGIVFMVSHSCIEYVLSCCYNDVWKLVAITAADCCINCYGPTAL